LVDTPDPRLPKLSADLSQLEQVALVRRPEIQEEWYRQRVNQRDIEIAKAQLWPSVGVDLSTRYDSNQYLYNNHWQAAGIEVSINLLRLLQLPALNASQQSQKDTDEMRRVALSMAVLTQVRIGALRYGLAMHELQFAEESLVVDTKLLDYARSARKTSLGSELELIRAEGRFLLSRYQREAAQSTAQAAWGRLYNSVGLDVFPTTIQSYDIKSLAQEIEKITLTMENQRLRGAVSGENSPRLAQ